MDNGTNTNLPKKVTIDPLEGVNLKPFRPQSYSIPQERIDLASAMRNLTRLTQEADLNMQQDMAERFEERQNELQNQNTTARNTAEISAAIKSMGDSIEKQSMKQDKSERRNRTLMTISIIIGILTLAATIIGILVR